MSEPVSIVVAYMAALAFACAAFAAASGASRVSLPVRLPGRSLLRAEADIAAALAIPWRIWVLLRVALILLAVIAGLLIGIWSALVLLTIVAAVGIRFAVAGRAARQRLRMERVFVGQLRVLRDRMAIGNQALDSALHELGSQAPPELRQTLRPLASGVSPRESLVACAERSHSFLVEQSCAVLLWARTRSLTALIETMDQVLLPIADAQLSLEEESLVTLSQHRAVAIAMAALMGFMFLTVVRVESFRKYYETPAGAVLLTIAFALFFTLITSIGRIMRVPRWTRWNIRTMAEEEARTSA